MKSDYSRQVEKLSLDFCNTAEKSGRFSPEEVSSFKHEISNRVLPLLQSPKPRILVYGIYNSGKSTLINAIIGHEVASVANRPETHKITPYDAGKYILVDSPGIDAPAEDEQMADDEIKKCHVILFVISSNAGFESKKNYQKMWELMQKGLPFIIVLNERAVPTEEEAKHLEDLNKMKSKIIKNLEQVSGRNDVDRKYEVIVVNAQRAWKGVSEGKRGFTIKSKISDLTSRIDQLLGEEVTKIYLAPLSALEDEVNNAEKILTAKTISADFASRREHLVQRIGGLKASIQRTASLTAERYKDDIFQCFMGESGIDFSTINRSITEEMQNEYKRAVSPVLDYIKKSFADVKISVDTSGNVRLDSKDNMLQQYNPSHDDDFSASLPVRSGSSSDEGSFMTAAATGAAAGAAIGSIVPVIGTTIGTAGGAIAGALLELGRRIFSDDDDSAEFERRLREVEAFNKKVEQRLEDEKRRRQDARTAANTQVNEIAKKLQSGYTELIEQTFSAVIALIDKAASANSRTMNELEGIKSQINALRKEIA